MGQRFNHLSSRRSVNGHPVSVLSSQRQLQWPSTAGRIPPTRCTSMFHRCVSGRLSRLRAAARSCADAWSPLLPKVSNARGNMCTGSIWRDRRFVFENLVIRSSFDCSVRTGGSCFELVDCGVVNGCATTKSWHAAPSPGVKVARRYGRKCLRGVYSAPQCSVRALPPAAHTMVVVVKVACSSCTTCRVIGTGVDRASTHRARVRHEHRGAVTGLGHGHAEPPFQCERVQFVLHGHFRCDRGGSPPLSCAWTAMFQLCCFACCSGPNSLRETFTICMQSTPSSRPDPNPAVPLARR